MTKARSVSSVGSYESVALRVWVSRPDGETAVVGAEGEVDLCTRTALLQRLYWELGPRPTRLTVDLSNVSFLDSAGLDGLLKFAEEARSAGVTPLFRVGHSAAVHRILRAVGYELEHRAASAPAA